jgi:hypothetical protein
MARYKKLVLLAAAGVLGFTAQAAAQKCTGDTCTGVVTFTSTFSSAVLLKVTAKDMGAIDPRPQNISVQVCGTDSLSAVVARTASPKDVFRCTTVTDAACTARPVQKSPTASSDSVVVTLLGVQGGITGRFTIRSELWDAMTVQVLDKSDAEVSFPPGTVHCF